MTEAEWLSSTDPGVMLAAVEGRASERKLRLFGVECCRHIPAAWQRSEYLTLLDAVERDADAAATQAEYDEALRGFLAYADREPVSLAAPGGAVPFHARLAVANAADTGNAHGLAVAVLSTIDAAAEADGQAAWSVAVLCGILRDIVGPLPFRPVTLDPAHRTDAALALARSMYDARDFAAMPILADALEEAGCEDPEILTHCRGPGPHTWGCWVADLVLGYAR
jgi:hypothetical protein